MALGETILVKYMFEKFPPSISKKILRCEDKMEGGDLVWTQWFPRTQDLQC